MTSAASTITHLDVVGFAVFMAVIGSVPAAPVWTVNAATTVTAVQTAAKLESDVVKLVVNTVSDKCAFGCVSRLNPGRSGAETNSKRYQNNHYARLEKFRHLRTSCEE
jgi:hypothetical protein